VLGECVGKGLGESPNVTHQPRARPDLFAERRVARVGCMRLLAGLHASRVETADIIPRVNSPEAAARAAAAAKS